MIPFDLERAKKGIAVRTRKGNKAVLIAELHGGQPAPLVMDIWKRVPSLYTGDIIDVPTKNGNPENYYIDGRHGTVHDSELDLFMEY
jgi:hypothetical protein